MDGGSGKSKRGEEVKEEGSTKKNERGERKKGEIREKNGEKGGEVIEVGRVEGSHLRMEEGSVYLVAIGQTNRLKNRHTNRLTTETVSPSRLHGCGR